MPRPWSRSKFIELAELKHTPRFDYSQVEECITRSKVTIICKLHGPFLQRPACHLRGKVGCKDCNGVYDTLSFIKKSESVFGKRYDYSSSVYKSQKIPIVIICPKHGQFEMLSSNHFRGNGCHACKADDKWKPNFTSKAHLLHHGRYDYSKVEYTLSNNYVDIICPDHGVFSQRPRSHLSGEGCPRCNQSKMEIEAAHVLKTLGVEHEPEFRLQCVDVDDPSWIRTLKCDFMFRLNDQQCVVELDGRQHHTFIPHFKTPLSENIRKDRSKNLACVAKGIHLLRISYKEVDEIESWICRFILKVETSNSYVAMVSNPPLYNLQRNTVK
jgi:very-short-patch-repair endonuclease